MIECTEKKIKIRKKMRKKHIFPFLLILLIIAVNYCYLHFFIAEVLADVCKEQASVYCAQSVNDAVLLSTTESVAYSDLVNVEKNNDGEITIISVNSLKVNSISQSIVKNTRLELQSFLDDGIPIPSFAFSGINLLSGYGAKVNFKSISIANVKCEFSSEFRSVGINQTLHSIYAIIDSEITVNIPLNKKTENIVHEVLLSESVIVGKVPQTYLNGDIFSHSRQF